MRLQRFPSKFAEEAAAASGESVHAECEQHFDDERTEVKALPLGADGGRIKGGIAQPPQMRVTTSFRPTTGRTESAISGSRSTEDGDTSFGHENDDISPQAAAFLDAIDRDTDSDGEDDAATFESGDYGDRASASSSGEAALAAPVLAGQSLNSPIVSPLDASPMFRANSLRRRLRAAASLPIIQRSFSKESGMSASSPRARGKL